MSSNSQPASPAPGVLDVEPPPHEPFVPERVDMPEFTWPALVVGALLGIVFGASSLYLVLKVGMTVSASIPVAVLSITLFRVLARAFGLRRATILENNMVQTTGSAGESIAFGVGVTMPALMLLGFDIDVVRVMTVGVLGGLLGILMMIPLRRAFIVKLHGTLPYPEGTACADVLIAGEKGGATAKTVFAGFGLAFLHKAFVKVFHLWGEQVDAPLYTSAGQGLKGGVIGGELAPELLGVGYIIGPRISAITFAGGALAYLAIVPLIVFFGSGLGEPLAPAVSAISAETGVDKGLIRNMSVGEIRNNYVLYIGAGAVATGGILSMLQALPMIFASVGAALRDLRGGSAVGGNGGSRLEHDLSPKVVVFGSLALVLALAMSPDLGLGFSMQGLVGGLLILLFGALFVTVSSRLTGVIGSSSNPISGMTVATLLLTCLVFVLLGKTDKGATLTALSVAAVVCIASSNGGTTSQDLKTGYLVGATPRRQQIGIVIGAVTSALVIGVTLLMLNRAGTVYTDRPEFVPATTYVAAAERSTENIPASQISNLPEGTGETVPTIDVAAGESPALPAGKYVLDDDRKVVFALHADASGEHPWRVGAAPRYWHEGHASLTETETIAFVRQDDGKVAKRLGGSEGDVREFRVWHARDGEHAGVPGGKYLVDDKGFVALLVDPAINGKVKEDDLGNPIGAKFEAPKARLMALIIDGIMNQKLPWGLVLIGALIAIVLELSGVPALPFAVGVYLPIQVSTPIFLGGMLRWTVDRVRKPSAEEAESSAGVLLSSGYIAGGALAGVVAAFLNFSPKLVSSLDFSKDLYGKVAEHDWPAWPALSAFGVLAGVLLLAGLEKILSSRHNGTRT